MPFHKTVSQLIDELAPETIPPVSAKAVAASVNKTLKAKRNPPADGVESSRKKKKRPAPEGEDGAEPTPKKKKKSRKSKVNPVEPPPDGTSSAAAVASTQAADPGPAIASAISPPAPNFTSLNVPPAEAERRREAAVRLLSGRGIDPTTLSTEQLSIFANQAPSLQETSLEMFAMYGAERLRIVHPNDAVGDASASPAPPAAAAAPGAANNIDPSLAVPQAVADGATRTKISIGAGAVVNVEENGTAGTTESTLKPAGIRTTRGACTTCKRRKVKCTKERPECRNCVLEQGEQCLYAPAKPRRKSEKTPAEAVSDQDEPEMAIEQNGVNGHSRVANPPTQSFSSINSAVEVQQQADRLAFSQQQQQQQQQPPHAPVQYTTALDAVQKALGQSSQANTPTTKTLKSRRRQAPETSIPVTQTLVPPPKIADHRRSLPVGPGTRQVTNQIPNIHAVPPTKTSMVQNSPTMTASPTTHAQQIQRPRYKRPGSTSVDANPSMPQSQPAYSLPPAAASIGVAQYQTSPSTTAVQPVRTRTPAAMTRRASPQTAYAAASQTGAVQSYSHTTTASDPTQDNYQRYNNASPDAYTSSWKPQNASSVAHDTAAYGTQQKTAKQAPPTGLTLPQYTASQTDSHSKRGGSNGAAPATQANGSRGRNASQTTNSQRTSHQPQTSQATAYNYNLPASQSASSYAVDNNMIPDSDSTASSAYGSSQATYGNYGNQQNTSDNHTQQNWYGSLPNGNHNRDSTYGSTATSNNALPTYQANTQRSGNVSGYSGHIYNQTSNQNIYDLFQSDRQH